MLDNNTATRERLSLQHMNINNRFTLKCELLSVTTYTPLIILVKARGSDSTLTSFLHNQLFILSQKRTHSFTLKHLMVYLERRQLHGTSAFPFTAHREPHTHMSSLYMSVSHVVKTYQCEKSHLHSPSSSKTFNLHSDGGAEREKTDSPVRAHPQETPGHTEEREKCVCPTKTQTRDASPCSATKSISHSLTSPPL